VKKECRLCGFGGQGIILAGILLAEAAGIYEGNHVVQVQDYGPAARGDSSKADVVISDSPIIYPKCSQLDLLVALSQRAYEENLPFIKRKGILIIDSDNVHPARKVGVLSFPMTQIAREQTGGGFGVNMVALGAVAAVNGIVKLESLEKAVHERVPPHTREQNRSALTAGFRIAKENAKLRKNAG
jgi:2-oxoglutarate ferredoxin oxidoreductase subunit gamma